MSVNRIEVDRVEYDFTATASLYLEGIANEVTRAVQVARKRCGLEVSDHIDLEIECTDGIVAYAIETAFAEHTVSETLADNYKCSVTGENKIRINGQEFSIKQDLHTPCYTDGKKVSFVDIGEKFPTYYHAREAVQ